MGRTVRWIIGSTASATLTYVLHLPAKMVEDAFLQWANNRVIEGSKMLTQSTSFVISWVLPFIIAVVSIVLIYRLGIKRGKIHSAVPTYAPGPYHYTFTLNGVNVIIDNIEESTENVSITGTVDERQSAVVIGKHKLQLELTTDERLEKFAWALLEDDLARRGNK